VVAAGAAGVRTAMDGRMPEGCLLPPAAQAAPSCPQLRKVRKVRKVTKYRPNMVTSGVV